MSNEPESRPNPASEAIAVGLGGSGGDKPLASDEKEAVKVSDSALHSPSEAAKAERRRLPVVQDARGQGAVRADGKKPKIIPADVHGRFDIARKLAFVALIVLWVALPWVHINGNPAVFVDVETRRFFLFGATFNAQDGWLLFFPLSGVGFGLIVLTAVLGRVWCGWACPQTVFLDGIYRKVERLIEGSHDERRRRDAGPATFDRTARMVAKHAAFIVISAALAHVVLAYFVSIPKAFAMVRGQPSAHPEAFAWMAGLTGVLYFNFAWFREQFCVVMCPYGRMQSVLFDEDSLVVGYDVARGEPRGKKGKVTGDCVDCGRCVAVCPTGIDIREGLQLDCIACTACIDACDEIMDKVERPRGLVRYDSTNGLAGKPRRFLRPRLALYAVLGLVGAVAATLAFRSRNDFEANVLRLRGAPYTFEGDNVRNAFDVHLVNKTGNGATYAIAVQAGAPPNGKIANVHATVSTPEVSLGSLEDRHVPIFLDLPRSDYQGDFPVSVIVTPKGEKPRAVVVTFLGAKK